MSKWLTLVLTGILLLTACSPLPRRDLDLCRTRWSDSVDSTFLEKAIKDLDRFQANDCKHAVIEINSPGGEVVRGLEVIRQMRETRKHMILETRGGAMAASMATVILAAGTPGYRLIDKHSLVIIHAIKRNDVCLVYKSKSLTEEGRMDSQLILTMASVLSELTQKPLPVTMKWLVCGKGQIGGGALALQLGLADRLQ